MTIEQKEYIEDTLIHKSYILQECIKLFSWFYENGEYILAEKLAKSCINHDNSKLSKIEYEKMSIVSAMAGKKPMTDPAILPNKEVSKILTIHWENNRHHPEHFNNPNEMNDIDIAEMVCDWSARSKQYGTNLMDFAKIRLENRFSEFSKENKEKILKYCEILSKN